MLITRISPLTDKANTLELPVTAEQMRAWESGALAQKVFPHLTPDQREFIITGLFPGEYEELFPEEEEDDEEFYFEVSGNQLECDEVENPFTLDLEDLEE